MKNIIRPLRILINKDNQRPYIIYKNKKYYVDNLNKKEILKLINRLSKKFKRKKIKNRKQIKKDINKNLTGIITSKIYEGYVNNQLSNKLDNINKDVIQINKKIEDNKNIIKFIDNVNNKIKSEKDQDLYILDKNGKYRLYVDDNTYLEGNTKKELENEIKDKYRISKELIKDNKQLETINLSNISKIDKAEKILKKQEDELDDLLFFKDFMEEVYIPEQIEPIINKKEEEQKIEKKKVIRSKKVKKTSAKRLKELLENISPDVRQTEQQLNEDYGEGFKKYINNRGIYTNEIKDIMKNIKFFLDVINIDDLNKLVDNIINNKLYKCCFIMNNNEEHWVACYIDLINDHEINYYDCLGNKAPDIFKNEMKRLIDSLNIDVYIKYKENLIKNQPDNSLLCAFYCISFILQRLAGLEFKYITNYKNLNENNIKELKQKYEKFKFI